MNRKAGRSFLLVHQSAMIDHLLIDPIRLNNLPSNK